MKKIVLILLGLWASVYAASVEVAVSITPQKTFVEAIGGERVNTVLMVLPGNSPHSYEPKAKQMKALEGADIYFAIGVEFEDVWLTRFASVNERMKIVDCSQGIQKLSEADGHPDPHVWLAPPNVLLIAKTVFQALTEADPAGEAYYTQRYDAFTAKVRQTDATIKSLLAPLKNRAFMVFHPSWSYFAQTYGLEQIAVEIDGKEPTPRELVALIKQARREKIRAIIVQPEFSDKSAAVLAEELGIGVEKVSPLNPAWSENLIALARIIAR